MVKQSKQNVQTRSRLRAIAAPLMGLLVAILVIAAFNSQYLFAHTLMWLQPSHAIIMQFESTEQAAAPISHDPRIIIPKLNVDAPLVFGMNRTDEPSVQKALESGVLHFAGSANPGQAGNAVFVGHSSNSVWAAGDYKFVFAMLERLEPGDEYALHHNAVRYIYRVSEKKIVSPSDVSVIANTAEATSTLITCTPTGTSLKRLVIHGEQVSPAPRQAGSSSTVSSPTVITLPGN